MKFRMHRGSLTDSMATLVEVDGRCGLVAYIRKEFERLGPVFADDQIKVKPYSKSDERIGWSDVHIVSIDGYGVVGFCEGPLKPQDEPSNDISCNHDGMEWVY